MIDGWIPSRKWFPSGEQWCLERGSRQVYGSRGMQREAEIFVDSDGNIAWFPDEASVRAFLKHLGGPDVAKQ